MANIPLSMFAFLLLLAIPVKVPAKKLRWLAFSLWLVGGGVLLFRGAGRVVSALGRYTLSSIVISLGLALGIGFFKGKWILQKASRRNRERLVSLDSTPLYPIQVYSLRSWTVIGVMLALALALNQGWIPLPLFYRGVVNLGIGIALVSSAFVYLE